MIRALVVGLILVTALLLQTTLFPHLSLAGFRPDLLLLVTMSFALRDGVLTGLRVGFAAGILTDLMLSQSALGLTALVYVGVGYGVGIARPYLAPESVTAPLILAFVSGLAATGGYGVLSRLLGDAGYTWTLIVPAAVFVAVYNTLLTPAVDGAIARFSTQFPIEGAPVR